ncbi:MAG: hypothetical protein OEQ29_07305, partial [Alphaproteobacteria bacterium]|nr:hypothetical protein [Alphaproteobacteria bacterium]
MVHTLSNLRIQTRIGILAAVTVFGVAIFGGAGFIADRAVNTVHSAYELNDKLVRLATEVHAHLLQMRQAEKVFLLSGDRSLVERHALHSRRAIRALDTLAGLPHAGSPRRQVQHLKTAMRRYPQSFTAMARLNELAGLNRESGLQVGIHSTGQDIERTLGQAKAYR